MATAREAVLDVIESVSREGDETTVVLRGELDISTIGDLRGVLEAECERCPSRLVLDFAQVEFVDSSALHLLVVTERQLRADGGGALQVVRTTEPVRRVFDITNLTMLLVDGTTNGRQGGT